ncbi:mitogen-activated protein kinase kinase kinase 20-related [Holotrichia oblita]|nr:mitogen-activated protein kinase kinase kinase 20-related [Holotrichia oblita]
MAIVYKAIDIKLDRAVTFKVMREEHTSDQEFIKRFYIEAKAAAKLSHQNIVNVYDVGQEGNIYFIVMEYVEGRTLKELITQSAPFSDSETMGVGIQIASALEAAHANGIIHRDIKPQNILVTTEGKVKVTDFGIAKATSGTTVTTTSNTMGSVHYFSPEQAKGRFVDVRSDIYSLGIVLFEMITGRLPYDGDTPVAVAIKHLNDPLPDIKKITPDITESLEKIILRATQKISTNRYESSELMCNDLKRALTNLKKENKGGKLSNSILRESSIEQEDIMLLKSSKPTLDEFYGDTEPEDEYDEDEEYSEINKSTERKVVFGAIGAALVIIAILSAIAFNIYKSSRPNLVEVPILAGKTIEEATTLITSLGLVLDSSVQTHDDNIPKDRIVMQNYLGGDMVRVGTIIKVSVSLGTDKMVVPKVVTYELTEALNILDGTYFDVKIEKIYSDNVPIDVVAEQSLKDGEVVVFGTQIVLYVSLGKEVLTTKVPNLTNLTEAAAITRLEEHKLVVQISRTEHATIASGRVITQTVSPDKEVEQGTVVGIIVSLGPPASTPTPKPTATPTPPPTATPTPTGAPNTETPKNSVKNIIVAPYIAEGINKVNIKLIKVTPEQTTVIYEKDHVVSDFPFEIEVAGEGKELYVGNLIEGRIIKGVGGLYTVMSEDMVLECSARGIFRKDKITPLVGDYVDVEIIDEKTCKGSINRIKNRKNELLRPRVSNIDHAVIVFAIKSPDINLDLLDKLIILAEEQKLPVTICINKIDLCGSDEYKLIKEEYQKIGYNIICASADKNESINVFKDCLSDKVSVMAGPSGVGKTSLINAVKPSLTLKTGQISAKIERVDSPGFTSITTNHINKELLPYLFKEFKQFLGNCKFADCSHIKEAGCIIKENAGLLMYILAPSMLAADFTVLGEQIKIVEEAGAKYLHIDVMDGDFVPNLSFGVPVIQSIRKCSGIVFDVHLMISKPERYIEAFAKAGADIITVHAEASQDINKVITQIKNTGKKASLSINPDTPVETVFEYCHLLDMVLLMSVHPGFGGQKFIGSSLDKAARLREYAVKNDLRFDIEMDGGISLENVEDVIKSGVNVIVAGSSVFGANNINQTVKEFLNIFSKVSDTPHQ